MCSLGVFVSFDRFFKNCGTLHFDCFDNWWWIINFGGIFNLLDFFDSRC